MKHGFPCFLVAGLSVLIDQFKASAIFADVFSRHAPKDRPGFDTEDLDEDTLPSTGKAIRLS